jgi:hypothetical protein
MILFICSVHIQGYMSEYLHAIKLYLRSQFNIQVDVIFYNKTYVIPDKYDRIIFVQMINERIIATWRKGASVKGSLKGLPPIKQPIGSQAGRSTVAIRIQKTKPTKIPIKPTLIPPPTKPEPDTLTKPEPDTLTKPEPDTPTKPEPDTPTKPTKLIEKKVYLLNTEQATMSVYLQRTLGIIRRYRVSVIDYSLENIKLLKRHLPHTEFIHFPYPIKMLPPVKKTIPIISLLSSPHRKRVAAPLGKIVNFQGRWGPQRDALIRNSKILVNIHFRPHDYRIFESIRCNPALAMQTLVVSEPSIEMSSLMIKDYIIFAAPGKMKQTVDDVLKNYDQWYEKMFSPQRIIELEQRFKTVYTHSLKQLYPEKF